MCSITRLPFTATTDALYTTIQKSSPSTVAPILYGPCPAHNTYNSEDDVHAMTDPSCNLENCIIFPFP